MSLKRSVASLDSIFEPEGLLLRSPAPSFLDAIVGEDTSREQTATSRQVVPMAMKANRQRFAIYELMARGRRPSWCSYQTLSAQWLVADKWKILVGNDVRRWSGKPNGLKFLGVPECGINVKGEFRQ